MLQVIPSITQPITQADISNELLLKQNIIYLQGLKLAQHREQGYLQLSGVESPVKIADTALPALALQVNLEIYGITLILTAKPPLVGESYARWQLTISACEFHSFRKAIPYLRKLMQDLNKAPQFIQSESYFFVIEKNSIGGAAKGVINLKNEGWCFNTHGSLLAANLTELTKVTSSKGIIVTNDYVYTEKNEENNRGHYALTFNLKKNAAGDFVQIIQAITDDLKRLSLIIDKSLITVRIIDGDSPLKKRTSDFIWERDNTNQSRKLTMIQQKQQWQKTGNDYTLSIKKTHDDAWAMTLVTKSRRPNNKLIALPEKYINALKNIKAQGKQQKISCTVISDTLGIIDLLAPRRDPAWLVSPMDDITFLFIPSEQPGTTFKLRPLAGSSDRWYNSTPCWKCIIDKS